MRLGELPPLLAGGDINPARFITISGSFGAVESNADDKKILGISTEGTKEAPTGASASTLAAEDGDNFRWHGAGEICMLQMDATGCTAGDFLKPDDSGMGDVAAAGESCGAIALETVAASEKCRVWVLPPGSIAGAA